MTRLPGKRCNPAPFFLPLDVLCQAEPLFLHLEKLGSDGRIFGGISMAPVPGRLLTIIEGSGKKIHGSRHSNILLNADAGRTVPKESLVALVFRRFAPSVHGCAVALIFDPNGLAHAVAHRTPNSCRLLLNADEAEAVVNNNDSCCLAHLLLPIRFPRAKTGKQFSREYPLSS